MNYTIPHQDNASPRTFPWFRTDADTVPGNTRDIVTVSHIEHITN
jgi:hypothetical protein